MSNNSLFDFLVAKCLIYFHSPLASFDKNTSPKFLFSRLRRTTREVLAFGKRWYQVACGIMKIGSTCPCIIFIYFVCFQEASGEGLQVAHSKCHQLFAKLFWQ